MLTNTRDAMLYWVGRCAAELFWIFYFQNGGRPPSWIWYDVIADYHDLCLTVLTSSWNCTLIVFILYKISRFLYLVHFAWSCLFTSLLESFGGYYALNKFRYCRNPQKDWLHCLQSAMVLLESAQVILNLSERSSPSKVTDQQSVLARLCRNIVGVRGFFFKFWDIVYYRLCRTVDSEPINRDDTRHKPLLLMLLRHFHATSK